MSAKRPEGWVLSSRGFHDSIEPSGDAALQAAPDVAVNLALQGA